MGKKPTDWAPIIDQLERHVVEGHHDEVKRATNKLYLKQVPRNFAWPLAELAWRIGEPILTLKLLNRIVFPKNALASSPTDREKFIYATALGNLGAADEAITIFESINSQKEPEVLLRKSLVHFRVWNYPAAIPYLEKFLAQSELTPYRRLIGKVNLAAAFVVDCKYDVASSLLQEIKSECLLNNYFLLLGNCYELMAQVEFFNKNFDPAISLLDSAIDLLKKQGGEFLLFAEKWKIICEAFKLRDSESLEKLRTFNKKSQGAGQWETARECDLFESILTQNEDLLRKVIIGTPFECYRARARHLFGKNILSQGHFHLELGKSQGFTKAFVFNPYDIQNENEGLHAKPLLLALFETLTLDFYKPSHIGLIFQKIYNGEKFDPFSSPKRVLGLIKRLNQWFEDQHVPLRVKMKKSEFCLIPLDDAPVSILVQRAKALSKQDGNLSYLRYFFSTRTFSAQNVSEKMKISRASALNLITQAVENGYVTKRGCGRGTTYALIPRNKKRATA